MQLNKRHEQIIPGYRKRQNPDFTGTGREFFWVFLEIKKNIWVARKTSGRSVNSKPT